MGDIARISVKDEEKLYKMFGINAELLIDHAWGWEPCTMSEIKSYRPETNSISSGQVLQRPYSFEQARLVAREMADLLVYDLVEKRIVTDQMELTVGYDISNMTDENRMTGFDGEIKTDYYGRKVPKSAHGSRNLGRLTSSGRMITEAVTEIFDRVVDKNLLVRRIYVVANHIVTEAQAANMPQVEQLSLFADYDEYDEKSEETEAELERENRRQRAIVEIKNKYGKNAIIKGMNLQEGATAISRNGQVGGHKA